MKNKATFYHAGCPVCVEAESMITDALDHQRYDVEIVHLGQNADRIQEAEALGIKSVPALAIDSNAFHINYGAALDDLKG